MMKQLSTLLLVIACALASCGHIKHITSTVHTVHDTVTVAELVHDTVNVAHVEYHETVKHDTFFKVPAAQAIATISHDQLQPLYNAKGIKQPHTVYKDTGNIHIAVTVDTAGNISIAVRTDSASIPFRNLEYGRDFINNDRTANTTAVATRTEKIEDRLTYKDTYVKVKSWLAGNWWWLLLLVLFGVILQVLYRADKKRKAIEDIIKP